MKRTLIRYKTKPDRTAENEALIKAVFAGTAGQVAGRLRYMSLKVADGTSCISSERRQGPAGHVRGTTRFQAFQSGIRDRCIEPPQSAR